RLAPTRTRAGAAHRQRARDSAHEMIRRHWTDLALTLPRARRRLEEHAARARTERARKAHIERALGVDLAARVICRALRRQSRRFDARGFMRCIPQPPQSDAVNPSLFSYSVIDR